MKRLINSILLSILVLAVFSQEKYTAEKFQAALMERKVGAYVVYTGDKHSFMLTIDEKITPSNQPNMVKIGNNLLQCSITPFTSRLNVDSLSVEIQMSNLEAYMKYEMDYIKEQLKSKKLNEQYELATFNNRLFIFWYYDMPKPYKSIDKQCYLATICFDQILVLNCPVQRGQQQDEIKLLMVNIARTLKLNNHPIDLDKLYKEINAN